VTHNKTTVSSS